MEVQMIAVWDMEKYVKEYGLCMIDLRENSEYLKGHIPGAVSIPYEENESCFQNMSVDNECCFHLMPMEHKYLLYCDRGNTSLLLGKQMGECGYCVYTLSGGYLAFEEYTKQRTMQKFLFD